MLRFSTQTSAAERGVRDGIGGFAGRMRVPVREQLAVEPLLGLQVQECTVLTEAKGMPSE